MHHTALIQTSFVSSLKNGDTERMSVEFDSFATDVTATVKVHPSEWHHARTALLCVEVEIESILASGEGLSKEVKFMANKAINLVKGTAQIIKDEIATVAAGHPLWFSGATDTAPPAKSRVKSVQLRWTASKSDLYEKIYGEYVMGSYNGGKLSLASLVAFYSELFSMAITEDECYQAIQRFKGRKGKEKYPLYGKKNGIPIPSRCYYHSEMVHRINSRMCEHEEGDGRKCRRNEPYREGVS